MRVFHIIPQQVLSNSSQGSYKDVISRVRWLERSSLEYCPIPITQDDPEQLQARFAEGLPTHILIEYTHYPKIVQFIKRTVPDVWLGVRAHNIEPLQHFDNYGWFSEKGPLWMLYGTGRLLWQDIQTRRRADAILSINEWENRAYWNRLPGHAQVRWVPYVCPEHLLPQQPLPYEKRNIIACLPISNKNRKSWDLVVRFQQFAMEMQRQGSSYDFVITGKLENWGLPICPAVHYTGFVENLAEFMGTCRAICMLSPLGYGFKTTIADALAAGAHVIAHPRLIRRSPQSVTAYMLSWDDRSNHRVHDLEAALASASNGIRLHGELCRQAADEMAVFLQGANGKSVESSV